MLPQMEIICNTTLIAHRQIGRVQRKSEFRSIVPLERKAGNISPHVYRQHKKLVWILFPAFFLLTPPGLFPRGIVAYE